MRIEERKGMTEAEADEFLKTLLLRFLVFVLIACVLMAVVSSSFAGAEMVHKGDNVFAGYSARSDSKIALGLRNNSFLYLNVQYVVGTSRAQNVSIYIDSVLQERDYVNRTASGNLTLTRGRHVITVSYEADHEKKTYSVFAINKSYERYVEEGGTSYRYTSGDLYSEGVKAFFGSLSAVVVTVAVVAWYRIPKLKKKVREIL